MSIELSPSNNVYVRLSSIQHLKLPQICLSLSSVENRNEDKPSDQLKRRECNSCQVMRRLLLAKDMAINRLTEDRDQLKVKLTQINNNNIELTQRLKRISSEKQDSTKANQESDQLIELRAKCDQLEAINKHLRQHLNTLRSVFNELHNSSESSGNERTNTTNTSTINTSDTSNRSAGDKTTSTLTDSNTMTANTSNNLIIGANNLTEYESSTQTSKSSFDKWYNK